MAETTMEARPHPDRGARKREKKKRKFSFPSAFTILFIVTIIAVICTWFVPAGQYSKLLYDSESGKLGDDDTDRRGVRSWMRPSKRSMSWA